MPNQGFFRNTSQWISLKFWIRFYNSFFTFRCIQTPQTNPNCSRWRHEMLYRRLRQLCVTTTLQFFAVGPLPRTHRHIIIIICECRTRIKATSIRPFVSEAVRFSLIPQQGYSQFEVGYREASHIKGKTIDTSNTSRIYLIYLLNESECGLIR